MLSFDVFSVGPQQPVERAVELTMTWDTMTLMWRHCNVINSYHIVMFVLLQGTVDIIVTSKYIWNEDREISQWMLIISVHLAHAFDCCNTCSPKGILNPLSWLWLAGLNVIEALFHMLPPDAHWPADPLNLGTGVQHGCVHRAHRQAPKELLPAGLLDTEPGFRTVLL